MLVQLGHSFVFAIGMLVIVGTPAALLSMMALDPGLRSGHKMRRWSIKCYAIAWLAWGALMCVLALLR